MAAHLDVPRTELTLTRDFNAPRELVFRVWTDPKHLARWWGPRHLTCPVCELDARPGGKFRVDMQTPDGTVFITTGHYQALVPPERIEMHCLAHLDDSGVPQLEVLNTITLEEVDGKTRLHLHAKVLKATAQATAALNGMEAGWTTTLDKLMHVVEVETDTPDRELVESRFYRAPRQRVFDMWTDPRHLEKWWGPRGFSTTVHTMDVRPGGDWHLVMHGPDGRDYDNRLVYHEVVRPERISYVHESAPLFHAEVSFTEEGDGTRLRMRMVFGSATQLQGVVETHHADQGLRQTLERLGELL